MSRYIDADLIEYHDSFTNDGEYARVAFGDDIDVLPTADVVEVVRCKDCRWVKLHTTPIFHKTYKICTLSNAVYANDFYCAFGERREDGEVH